jgi:hypothetical protein
MHSLLFRDNDLNLLCKNFDNNFLGRGSTSALSIEGFNSASDAALQKANTDLVAKIDNLKSDTDVSDRAESYFSEDKALVLYINKMMIFMYIIIYLVLLFGLYMNYAETTPIKIGIIVVIFTAIPFTIDFLSKFLYKRFHEILQFFYKGNSLYLYTPKKFTDTL